MHGSVTGFPPNLFGGKKLYVGIKVATDNEMVPRIALTSQAYARLAAQAVDVKDRDINPRSVKIGPKLVIDSAGKWVGDPTGLQGTSGATDSQSSIGLRALNLREMERAAVERSLDLASGNRTLAARALGVSTRTLRNKIRGYGLR